MMRLIVKVGDLVRARLDLFDENSVIPEGDIGIITKRIREGQSWVHWTVKFSKSMYQTNFAWGELEVISENR